MKMEDSKEEKLKFSLDSFETFARNGIVAIQTNDSATLTQISDAWEIYSEVMRNRLTSHNDSQASNVSDPIAPLPAIHCCKITSEKVAKTLNSIIRILPSK